ncbi:MAG TPA: c-type cytochrome biogenesis protein CcmI [Micromonosporaceae bacterium]|nr:c-type cytochrome biogenesis protein CcmI [Micromonosporaceae bacterium]
MTAVIVIGLLTFAAGLVVLRPFSDAHRQSRARPPVSDDARRRELLRQLRDLDDDLAAGKLTAADHDRLAAPVEREAAAALRRARSSGRPGGSRGSTGVAVKARPATTRPAAGGAKRWRRGTVTVLALAGGVAGVTLLLLGAVTPRTAGETISGNQVGGAAPASPEVDPSDGAALGQQATPEQLAAIDAAAQRVKQNPKDVDAHLALATAYAAGGANQLAAVEYLAVTQLDPSNAEAGTALAQLAYVAGQPQQAKSMLDTVLAAHPDYPEALYARGLILLETFHQPKAAEKDLNAYLAVAPFGAQRTQAETLLALASSQDH